jgi:hypothetical protein
MAQVMYDKAIRFDGQIYSVTQTWNGPQITVLVIPPNEKLRTRIVELVGGLGQITLYLRNGYWEIEAAPG